jgi:hypothetical protein
MNACLRILIGVEFATLLSLGFAIGIFFLNTGARPLGSVRSGNCVELGTGRLGSDVDPLVVVALLDHCRRR